MRSLIVFILLADNALCGYHESKNWMEHSDCTFTRDRYYKSGVTANTDTDTSENDLNSKVSIFNYYSLLLGINKI